MTFQSTRNGKRGLAWIVPAFFLAGVEGMGALGYLVSIPGDPKNSLLMGFSAQRLALMAVALLGSAGFFSLGAVCWRSTRTRDFLLKRMVEPGRGFFVLMNIAAGWLVAFITIVVIFGIKPYPGLLPYYQRMLPLLAWAAVLAGQALLILPCLRYGCTITKAAGALWKEWRSAQSIEPSADKKNLKPDRLFYWCIVLLVLAVLMPASNTVWFSGLPVGKPLEFLAVLVVVPMVFSRDLQAAIGGVPAMRRRIFPVVLAALAAVLVCKGVLLASGTGQGFAGCYRSSQSQPPTGDCELSFENVLQRGGYTRLDKSLDFDYRTWNLSYINSIRFNYYWWWDGYILRDRVPLDATWRGETDIPPGAGVEVNYTGEGWMTVGGVRINFPAAYSETNIVRAEVPSGRQTVEAFYHFDDGYRTGDPNPPGPHPTFQVRVIQANGSVSPMRAVLPAFPWRLAGWLVDGILAMIFTGLGGYILWMVRRFGWILTLCIAAGLIVYRTQPELAFMAIMPLFFLLLAGQQGKRWLMAAYVGLAFLLTLRVLMTFPDFNHVLYRVGGSDSLTYESLGRDVIETRSLEGGEKVYFYQPLFRYIIAGLHILLGDGDATRTVGALTALNLGVFVLFDRLIQRRRKFLPRWAFVASLAAGGLAMLFLNSDIVYLVEHGYSEYPTWIFLLYAFVLLVNEKPERGFLAATALVGFAAITRMNNAPPLFYLFGIFALALVFRGHWKVALGGAAILTAIFLLPALHNLAYGGQFAILPTSSNIPGQPLLPPMMFLRGLRDPEVMSLAGSQVSKLLGWMAPPKFLDVSIPMWGLLAGWLYAAVRLLMTWRSQPLVTKLFMFLPLAYLGVQFFFDLTSGYPRHLVAAYLAMAVCVWMVEGRRIVLK